MVLRKEAVLPFAAVALAIAGGAYARLARATSGLAPGTVPPPGLE